MNKALNKPALSLVPCPICGKQVANDARNVAMNIHLDLECLRDTATLRTPPVGIVTHKGAATAQGVLHVQPAVVANSNERAAGMPVAPLTAFPPAATTAPSLQPAPRLGVPAPEVVLQQVDAASSPSALTPAVEGTGGQARATGAGAMQVHASTPAVNPKRSAFDLMLSSATRNGRAAKRLASAGPSAHTAAQSAPRSAHVAQVPTATAAALLQQASCQLNCTAGQDRRASTDLSSPNPLALHLPHEGQYTIQEHPELKGQIMVLDFVTPEEEAALLHMVESQPPAWRVSNINGTYRSKNWGVVTDLAARTTSPPRIPLPTLLAALGLRMRAVLPLLAGWAPNEGNALDYRRGVHALRAHVDDRQLSGPFIVTLSLAGRAVMTFAPDTRAVGSKAASGNEVRVFLPQRALQVLSRDVRYSYTHAIHAPDLLDPRRVSITLRQVKL